MNMHSGDILPSLIFHIICLLIQKLYEYYNYSKVVFTHYTVCNCVKHFIEVSHHYLVIYY